MNKHAKIIFPILTTTFFNQLKTRHRAEYDDDVTRC